MSSAADDPADGSAEPAESADSSVEPEGDVGSEESTDGNKAPTDESEEAAQPEQTADLADPEEPAEPEDPANPIPAPEDRGETLFVEQGGSWWVVAIGPVLAGAVLAMDIAGPGRVHWLWISVLGAIITLFSIVQVYAARRHVGVELTETTLQQGTLLMALADIEKIYPANNGAEHEKWESAPALGELAGVPRRRKGVGVKLVDGKLAQAWARDVERFRQELTEAHLAVQLGVSPRGPSS
ncbi:MULTISPECIES: hypothetical protein [Gordonia]|uniref:DUF3093 domain-containing protein n=1 Tax=Gordonia jacobaea TaxID=122202 RepID=A0ABR5I771_9ACTN|nr:MULTISPECIES: hypothetical protein [Gordonia]KNA89504.1 hypothetical protein ABW18_20130 [Gordonia jacobaea]OBC05711.1 hypothetical protein A5785_12460 [Gordonia sp. 852002-50395_SCH5434458]OBC14819.1 hypothetical protein A5786_22190 [Gordonia sp. 852002-50816_SCH5313054-a]OBC18437.1 hypothetical protein A5788_10005 [Gordonia sp. 852002-50816_SCH5313054-c]